MAYKVRYTEQTISNIIKRVYSDKVFERIERLRKLLETTPELGRVYNPDYPAAKPPFECRILVVSDSPFALYYVVNEDQKEVVIFHIEDQRMDPQERFAYSLISF